MSLLPSYSGATPIGATPEEMAAAMKAHAAYERTMNILNGYIDASNDATEIASLDAKYPNWKNEARQFARIRAENVANGF
jgi:hypothetical protein